MKDESQQQVPPGIVAFKNALDTICKKPSSMSYHEWVFDHLYAESLYSPSTIHTISVDGKEWSVGDEEEAYGKVESFEYDFEDKRWLMKTDCGTLNVVKCKHKLPPPSQPVQGKEETIVKLSADNEFLVIRGNRYLIMDTDSYTTASVMTIGPNPGQYTGEHDLPISKAIQMFNQTANPDGELTPYQRGLTPDPQPHEQGKEEEPNWAERYTNLFFEHRRLERELTALKSKPSEEEIEALAAKEFPYGGNVYESLRMGFIKGFDSAIQWLSSWKQK